MLRLEMFERSAGGAGVSVSSCGDYLLRHENRVPYYTPYPSFSLLVRRLFASTALPMDAAGVGVVSVSSCGDYLLRKVSRGIGQTGTGI